jgi:hypothetical protein
MDKTRRLNIRFSDSEMDELEAVSEFLGLTSSAALRFLIHEKYRALGTASTSASAKPAKKKRRAGS